MFHESLTGCKMGRVIINKHAYLGERNLDLSKPLM